MTEEPVEPALTDQQAEEPRPDPMVQEAALVAQFIASGELMHDARTIMRLGSGLFELDLRKNQLRHSLRYYPPLRIVTNLRARIAADLQGMQKTWDDLTQATVNFNARLEERDPAKGYRPKNMFARYSGLYVLCHLEIKVLLALESEQ